MTFFKLFLDLLGSVSDLFWTCSDRNTILESYYNILVLLCYNSMRIVSIFCDICRNFSKFLRTCSDSRLTFPDVLLNCLTLFLVFFESLVESVRIFSSVQYFSCLTLSDTHLPFSNVYQTYSDCVWTLCLYSSTIVVHL